MYIWHDSKQNFRSKMRVISNENPIKSEYPPNWNYDGSSTGQAETANSEILLVPVASYHDKYLTYVLCSCHEYSAEVKPIKGNTIFNVTSPTVQNFLTSIGLRMAFEQEFCIYKNGKPLLSEQWDGLEQGEYYCSVGAVGNGFIEKYVREVFEKAIEIGINVTGYNLEVAPAQGEIQVDSSAIKAAHDLTMLRYLLYTILGKYDLVPNFDAKPYGEKYNGSGLHTNVSVARTMIKGGLDTIHLIMKLLSEKHKEWMPQLGEGNEKRLTGTHETSSIDNFTWSVGSRSCSVRIPNSVNLEKKGYFEDRRPAANADPYKIVWLYTQLFMQISKSDKV